MKNKDKYLQNKADPAAGSGQSLRQKAEALALEKAALSPEDLAALSPEETGKMLYELQVHQIELQMQNNQLRSVQAELEASRERYFDLYDLAPVGYCTLSEHGLILETNLTFATLLNVARSNLIKKPITRFILPEDQDIYYRHHKELFETGKPQVCELRMLRADGPPFCVRVDAAAARDEQGAPVCRCVLSDTTEHNLAEEALREAESLYRLHFENVSDVIYSVDRELKVVNISPSVETVLGYKPEHLIGRPFPELNLLSPEYLEKAAADTIRVLGGERIPSTEYRFIARDGTIIWAEISGSPLIRDGQVVAVISVARDITERKRAEEEREKLQAQLIQARKMESVGRLAGGVAHDYNNMLSVIIGNAELAMGRAAPDDPLHEELSEILNAARRSADITRQLLAFARKQSITPRVLDLNETVERMLKMLRRLIGEDIDLVWHPGADHWPVRMDPGQIDQILANLCVNTRDAIGGVGKVTIETGKAVFDEAYCADHAGFVPGEFALLAVSDDGSGMDKATLDNLFEPFFTTKGVGKGTGLGLATVYGIVKQNNGFINVYSEPGEGSTFKIYLPRHVGEAEKTEKEDAADIPPGRGETVLIVEDEASVLKLARRILERLGYTVLESSTPERAMDLAQEHGGEIHLLITDVVMPGINGRELAEQLQSPYPDLKVLFMSGYTADVIAHRGILEAGVHFMQKPFSNRDMAIKVREALDS